MATPTSARQLVEEVARDAPLSLELALLAAFAVRVDPPLLRRLRLELLPGSSPAVEAELWQGSLVSFRGPDGFVFAQGVGVVLREQLATKDPARYERAWNITKQVHRSWLSPALQLEEELNYLQSSPNPASYEQARDLMRSAVAELVRNPSPGVAQWAVGATARLPSDLMDMEEGRMLAMAARTRLPGSLIFPSSPPGPVPEWMAWLAPEGLERIALGVKMFPDAIELMARSESHDNLIELPGTNPLVVEVAEPDEDNVFVRPRRVFIDRSGSDRRSRALGLRIREALRRTPHQAFLVDEVIQPGDPISETVEGMVEQCEAFVLLFAHASRLSPAVMESLTRGLSTKPEAERKKITFVLVHVLTEDATALPAPPWLPVAGSEQVWIEARPRMEQQVIQRTLEALNDSRQRSTRWRRIDLPSSGSVRIPLASNALRLRTLLGNEYVIEPARVTGLQEVPPPVDGLVAHPQVLDLLLREVAEGSTFIAISGPAGIGKTQLVRQLLARLEPDFPQGRYLFDIKRFRGSLSARSIARDLVRALAPERDESASDALRSYNYLTSERRMALVLEDVDSSRWNTPQIASVLNDLRPRGLYTLLLVTSRERIDGLGAKQVVLAAPNEGIAMGLLMGGPVPRAYEHLVEIAELLQYRTASLYEVGVAISQLPSDFNIARYVLLLRQAFLLNVFPDSFDLRAAEVVLVGEPPPSEESSSSGKEASMALEMLQVGLLEPVAPGRYTLWWPIRQSGEPRWDISRWDESGFYVASFRHGVYFLNLLASLHVQYMQGGAIRAESIATFDTESVNIILAIEWLLPRLSGMKDEPSALHVLSSLVTAAPTLLRLRRPPQERERIFQYVSSLQGPEEPFILLESAIAQADLGQGGQALKACERARAQLRSTSDNAVQMSILVKLARFQLELGEHDDARSTLLLLQEGEGSSGERGAEFYYVDSNLHFLAGRRDEAEHLLQRARALAADERDIRLEVDAWLGLASIAAEKDELSRAAALCEEALEFARAWRDDRGAALASWELGRVRIRQGIRERAGELLQVLTDYYRAIGHVRAKHVEQEREALLRPWEPERTRSQPLDSKTNPVGFRNMTERISRQVMESLDCNYEIAYDAAVDAILNYLGRSHRDDLNSEYVESILTRDAIRRVSDRLRSEAARVQREQDFADITELQSKDSTEEVESRVDADNILALLVSRGYLKEEKDMVALRLLLQGERSTETLAKALLLDALPRDEMRREVKRHRDRLMKVLSRFRDEDSDSSS